jgi:hypothetical protein
VAKAVFIARRLQLWKAGRGGPIIEKPHRHRIVEILGCPGSVLGKRHMLNFFI